MTYYYENRKRAQFKNVEPTLTDQSGAKDTDINIIVGQFLRTGSAPGTNKQPLYEDFTQYPDDLRGFIEAGRAIKEHIADLPEQLRNIPLNELLALPPQQIADMLKPPATPPATQDEKK